MNQPVAVVEGQVVESSFVPDRGALEAISSSEINVQIATAKRFPRSVKRFQEEALSLVSMNEDTADDCVYAIERDGKTIEGPSARLAEIVAYSWGNCRADARVTSEEGEFVTARGIFWDLEKNTAIGYEVKRRIVNRRGQRYSADMIGVTANAACSIALRNAVLKGVPKAFWSPAYAKAKEVIVGDFTTLEARRSKALTALKNFGVLPAQVFEKLGVAGEPDIMMEHIVTLRGFVTALREQETTPEELFPPKDAPGRARKGATDALKETLGAGAASPPGSDHSSPTTLAEAIEQVSKLDAEGLRGYVSSLPEELRMDAEFQNAYNRRCGDLAEAATRRDHFKDAWKEGLPKHRKEFIERLQKAKTRDDLDVAFDETRQHVWKNEDYAKIRDAYEKGKHRLEA
jgi:hypothetical protein